MTNTPWILRVPPLMVSPPSWDIDWDMFQCSSTASNSFKQLGIWLVNHGDLTCNFWIFAGSDCRNCWRSFPFVPGFESVECHRSFHVIVQSIIIYGLLKIWGFPEIGLPWDFHPFSWDFPWNTPSSEHHGIPHGHGSIWSAGGAWEHGKWSSGGTACDRIRSWEECL